MTTLARKWHTTRLLPKHRAIMDEDLQTIPEFVLSPEHAPPITQSALHSDAASTAQPRPSLPRVGTHPQFLHSSGWPIAAAVDEVVGNVTQALDNDSTVADLVLTETSSCETVNGPVPDSANTNAWHAVTPEQISMALDQWDPDDSGWPHPAVPIVTGPNATPTADPQDQVGSNRQSLFLREIMDEYLTRIQTVEHVKELRENDKAGEVVSMLEQYRQIKWAEEMVEAFPIECGIFWSNSGLGTGSRGDSTTGPRE